MALAKAIATRAGAGRKGFRRGIVVAAPAAVTSAPTHRLLWKSLLVVVAALSMVGVTAVPANAHGPDHERSPVGSTAEELVLAAVQRDLGLGEEQARALIAGSAVAAELAAELRAELGDAYAGSWVHQQTGALVVAVTDPHAARTVRANGARAKLVGRGKQQLEEIMTEVGVAAEVAAEAGNDGIQEWYVDPEANQVVVTVQAGKAAAVADLRAARGNAVRVETAAGTASPGNHGTSSNWLDAGIAYSGCSTGFNLRNHSTGARYILTAGHCHRLPGTVSPGGTVSSHGTTIGPVDFAFFGPRDDGLVRVTNTGSWSQGSYAWAYGGAGGGAGNPGTFITINGWADPPVGALTCKSGRTTFLTCGNVQAKNVTVNYNNGNGTITTVNNLVRHTACMRRGDSGGPVFTFGGGQGNIYRAIGTNSGMNNLANDQCRSTQGGTNITYYYPITRSLPRFNQLAGVSMW